MRRKEKIDFQEAKQIKKYVNVEAIKKPKNLSDYDTAEICPSCHYEFTNYAIIEPKQKTLEITCPHCHHVFKKRITKRRKR
jgi:DNA-directed RNA polymerase subunit RPC12/RpoP